MFVLMKDILHKY